MTFVRFRIWCKYANGELVYDGLGDTGLCGEWYKEGKFSMKGFRVLQALSNDMKHIFMM